MKTATQEEYSTSTKDPQAAHYCDPIESALLSALMNYPKEMSLCASLAPVDFGRGVHQTVFKAMRACAPDFASVEQQLRQQGEWEAIFPQVLSIYNDPAALSGINPVWIDKIKECALRRKLWHSSEQIAALSLRDDLDTVDETQQCQAPEERRRPAPGSSE